MDVVFFIWPAHSSDASGACLYKLNVSQVTGKTIKPSLLTSTWSLRYQCWNLRAWVPDHCPWIRLWGGPSSQVHPASNQPHCKQNNDTVTDQRLKINRRSASACLLWRLLIHIWAVFNNRPRNGRIAFHSCSETKYIFTSILMWPFLWYVAVLDFHCGHFRRSRFGLWPFLM